MKPYDHKKIEKKWQKEWESKKVYKTLSAKEAKEKNLEPYYVLDMFPYPSGAGLHVGHPRGYIASDVFARMKRMEGYNVLHPMGFDSFGLPAEQYAIQTGKNPGPFTNELVKRYREQLSILGFSYDWDRQVETHDPEYYKWTQWVFLQIYNSWYDEKENKARPISELVQLFEETDQNWKNLSEKEQQDVLMNYRLAYEGYATVNWCEEMGTVLANDEVVEKNGKMVSERGEYPVVKKQMRQWFMRITAYADRLLAGLETIDWPHSIKEIQKNWIGKSEGSEIDFAIKSTDKNIKVFTTRADTLFGVTYVVLAPEHELVNELKSHIKNWSEIEKYIKEVKSKSDEDRAAAKEKTGIVLEGIFAINPANNEQVPIWIADYVLASYGTGAVMAVPAHDERDFEFAKKYNLPIKEVVLQSVNEQSNITPVKKDTGALAIIVDEKAKKVLLQYDGATKLWRLPGGGVDMGEALEEAVLREVREETGYANAEVISSVGSLHVYFHKIRAGVLLDRRAYGFVLQLKNNEVQKLELSESEKTAQLEHTWHPFDEALKLLKSNTIPMGEAELFERHLKGVSAYTDYGILVDSGKFDGMASEEVRKAITEFVGGKLVTKYKMRDAIFARQRYWGEPIPLVHVPLEKKYKDAFEIPFYSEFPFELLSKKEKTVETRSLDKPGRDKVKAGDVVRIEHLPTKRLLFARVTATWKFENIKDLWENGRNIVKEIRPEKNMSSYEELHEFYANVDPGYAERCDTHGMAAWRLELLEGDIIEDIPEKDLPLELPKVKSYAPAGDGQSPLATVSSWVKAGYETNTMPGWAGSSWYFLRYTDPKNKEKFADEAELDYWFSENGGVNMYVGGAEHATGHLLYSRFWHKVLKDLGHVQPEEPFQKLRNQGMIGGTDGRKMSKRWGNVINPDDVVRDLGADTMRVYESFMGPFEAHLPWSTDGIVGSRRFIERVWKLQEKVSDGISPVDVQKSLHKTIKKVTDDISTFGFNTAVSAMMIFVNVVEKAESITKEDFAMFLKILAPFAPHVADELWELLEQKGTVHHAPWPSYDPKLIVEDSITMGIQVNGKVRAEIELALDATETDVEEKVMQMPEIIKWTEGKTVKKFIFIPKKIISIVVE